MSGGPIPVTAHPDGKNMIQGRDVLQMWVDKAPDRLVFVSLSAGDAFRHHQMPPKAQIEVRGQGGRIGTITKISERGSIKLR